MLSLAFCAPATFVLFDSPAGSFSIPGHSPSSRPSSSTRRLEVSITTTKFSTTPSSANMCVMWD